jgi:hypothetical protein
MCVLLNGEAGLKPVLKGRLIKTLLKADLKPRCLTEDPSKKRFNELKQP